MSRTPDAGESSASINRRSDDKAWPHVEHALRSGFVLRRIAKLQMAYPSMGRDLVGPGITDTRLRKLLREGVLSEAGLDTYKLAEVQS